MTTFTDDPPLASARNEPATSVWLADNIDLAAQRGERRRPFARRVGTGALGLLLLLGAWELLSVRLNDSVILPSVQATARTFAHYLTRPYPTESKPLWLDLAISLRRILIGFGIGSVIGVSLGALMTSSRVIRHLIDPIIEVTRPLPPLAFIPLFIVWFGIGETPKIILIVVGVVPVMTIATVAALDAVPEDLELCARTLGASKLYTLVHVQMRAAIPGVLTGMRISMGGAWGSIVAAEMLAATSGVGYVIMQAGNYLNTGIVFSGIFLIAITGLTLDACLRGLVRLSDPSRR